MTKEKENIGYGISVFRPGTPPGVKKRGILFFILACTLILVQSCYWLFANSVYPILLGMPLGMFFTVLFIGIEFVVFLVLYILESKDSEVEEGGAG